MAVFATSFTYITLPHRSSYAIIGNFIDVEKLYANVSGLFVRPYYCKFIVLNLDALVLESRGGPLRRAVIKFPNRCWIIKFFKLD